jgi:hypothetical protein
VSITPIFIFSLPRSGSTLLQRILGTHSEISTAPEPWILLPLFHSVRSKGVYADYGHNSSVKAISDFIDQFPEGMNDYFASLRLFVLDLYEKAAKGTPYFLDKTPRYTLISDEIIRIFPDAKFVFLFRNPLSVLASIITTWRSTHIFRIDLYAGLDGLIKGSKLAHEKACHVRYEDLIVNPDTVLQDLCASFTSVDIPLGRFGNPVSRDSKAQKYSKITSEPLDKWKNVLCKNPLRKRLAQLYLDYVGEERLIYMGYDPKLISNQLGNLSTGYREIGSDGMNIMRGIISVAFETAILRDKIKKLPEIHHIYAHR